MLVFFRIFIRNGVVTASSPRMAATDAFYSQPAAFKQSVFLQGFNGIMRTGGCVPATARCIGRYSYLVKTHQKDKRKGQYFSDDIQNR